MGFMVTVPNDSTICSGKKAVGGGGNNGAKMGFRAGAGRAAVAWQLSTTTSAALWSPARDST
jgi:hypothetical protein